MRIRKNAKLSSLINLTRAKSVHVCELNQSPWDVIPSTQEPYPSYLHHRFEPEDIFNGNGSLGDSIGAVESVASMMDNEDKSIMKVERDYRRRGRDENSSLTSKKAGNRRGRAGAANKGQSSTSNPYELYYYFGSGPSWRRRGGNNSEMRENYCRGRGDILRCDSRGPKRGYKIGAASFLPINFLLLLWKIGPPSSVKDDRVIIESIDHSARICILRLKSPGHSSYKSGKMEQSKLGFQLGGYITFRHMESWKSYNREFHGSDKSSSKYQHKPFTTIVYSVLKMEHNRTRCFYPRQGCSSSKTVDGSGKFSNASTSGVVLLLSSHESYAAQLPPLLCLFRLFGWSPSSTAVVRGKDLSPTRCGFCALEVSVPLGSLDNHVAHQDPMELNAVQTSPMENVLTAPQPPDSPPSNSYKQTAQLSGGSPTTNSSSNFITGRISRIRRADMGGFLGLGVRVDLTSRGIRHAPEVRLMLSCDTQVGFSHIGRYESHCKIEPDLISILVERWRPETHTFQLPCGECTITLEDVSMHLGLPVDRDVISGMAHGSWTALCRDYLGRVPESFNGGQIPLNWLDVNFWELSEDVSDDEVKMYAWACILQLIGGLLMPDKTRNQFQWRCVERLTTGKMLSADVSFCCSLGHAIPPELRGPSDVWMVMVPLICYAIVEWHSIDRVLWQFSCFQPISKASRNMDELHSTDRRGKSDTDWLVKHHAWVVLWEDRHRLPHKVSIYDDLLTMLMIIMSGSTVMGNRFLLSKVLSMSDGIVSHTPPGSLFYGGATSLSVSHQQNVFSHDDDDDDGDDDSEDSQPVMKKSSRDRQPPPCGTHSHRRHR
ncbi:Syntaxin of plants 71 [Hibiscus syriacus]|uniref:Syntaxin of plants 71 n=1 Tax=Hibiscus syriacus TaxID=106335 RepID=A0A6A2ZZ14_HIBSY|nr:Syntaxin of plants 71 [Hibiscus syriacus]